MAERKINGKVFRVQPMTAGDAISLYADIMRLIGPAAGKLPAIILSLSSGDEGRTMMADVAALAALSDILGKTASSDISDLIRRIVESTMVSVDGGKTYDQTIMDVEFTGHLGDFVPVVRFVLEEQYRDFFPASGKSGILSLLAEALQKRK